MPCFGNDNVCGGDYNFAARDDRRVGCDCNANVHRLYRVEARQCEPQC
jgi:hypothetical protein